MTDTRAKLSNVNQQLVAIARQLLQMDDEAVKDGTKGVVVITWDWDCMVGNHAQGSPLHKILWAGQEYLDKLELSETGDRQREDFQKLLKSIRRRANR